MSDISSINNRDGDNKTNRLPSDELWVELLSTKGRVHSVETMGLLDGPGIRTVFFLQGCPLKCAYCHNVDTQDPDGGKVLTVEEVVKTAKRYKNYYGVEGGITFSGGEPLMQGEFLYSCLKVLKKEGFNLCLDTSGFGDRRYYKKIMPLVDTMLLDVKAFSDNSFYSLVKGRLAVLQEFMDNLFVWGFKGQLWIRHVMLPGYTDNELAMRKFIRMIMPLSNQVERIEILPYHLMGLDKYETLGIKFQLEGLPAMDKKRAFELQVYANTLFANYLHIQREERKELMNTEINAERQLLSDKEKNAAHETLRSALLFHDMSSDEFRSFISDMKFFKVNKGNFVFKTSDPAEYMYIICKGHIKIYENTSDGHEQICYIYGEGDFVGGLNILKHASYLYMGQAIDDCIIAAYPKELFNKNMLNNVEILHHILEKSFDRIRHAENLIRRLSTSNVAMKVAALLLRLVDSFGVETQEGIRLDLSINMEEMANYAGLTREVIARKLGEFKELGYIEFIGNKVIIIKNIDVLKEYCF